MNVFTMSSTLNKKGKLKAITYQRDICLLFL